MGYTHAKFEGSIPDQAKMHLIDAGNGKIAMRNKYTGRYCTGHHDKKFSCNASSIGTLERFTLYSRSNAAAKHGERATKDKKAWEVKNKRAEKKYEQENKAATKEEAKNKADNKEEVAKAQEKEDKA